MNELLKALTNAKGTQAQRTIMLALLILLAVRQDEMSRRVTTLEKYLLPGSAAVIDSRAPQTNVTHQATGPQWPAHVARRYGQGD